MPYLTELKEVGTERTHLILFQRKLTLGTVLDGVGDVKFTVERRMFVATVGKDFSVQDVK